MPKNNSTPKVLTQILLEYEPVKLDMFSFLGHDPKQICAFAQNLLTRFGNPCDVSSRSLGITRSLHKEDKEKEKEARKTVTGKNPTMNDNMNKGFNQVAAFQLGGLDDRVANLDEKIDKIHQRIAKQENAIEPQRQTPKTKAQKPAATTGAKHFPSK